MTTAHSSRNTLPTESSSSPSPVTTPTKRAKPSPSDAMLLSTPPVVPKHGKETTSSAYGFPSTPVNMVMTPSITNTPCITPIPNHESAVQGDTRDELDIMLCHEDFPKLLNLASQVKSLHFHGSVNAAPQQANGKDGPLEASEVLLAVTRLQERLLSTSKTQGNELSVAPSKIGRGVCPMTDSLFDDSFAILRQELDRCQRLATSQPKTNTATMPKKKKTSSKSQKEAIAIKYSKWQTDILMQWMIEHIDNPFPDQDEVHELMHETNLSYSQVINWTTNVRKRNRKATCEEKKKPHHFIDFLFLAQKRDAEREDHPFTPESTSRTVVDTPSRTTGTATEGDTTPIMPPSQKKRKLDDCPLPPLRASGQGNTPKPAAHTPSPSHYPGTPSPHHGAPYSPYQYHPEYGYTMAFPTSPAYFYGHSPYHGDPRAQHASPYHHHPYYQQGHHGPSPPPHGARPGHGNGQPPVRHYQRQPPSRPPTPVGSESRLQSIHEEEAQESPTAKAQNSGGIPDESPVAESSPFKIKRERETDTITAPTDIQQEPPSPIGSSYPSSTNAAIKKEPASPPTSNSGGIPIKPDPVLSISVKQEAGAAPVSFDDGTAMDPIDIDEPTDNAVLQDFAMFWEINLEEDSADGDVDPQGHAIFVLRSGSGGVPDLVDEGQQTAIPMPDEYRSSDAMEVDEVPSDMAIGA